MQPFAPRSPVPFPSIHPPQPHGSARRALLSLLAVALLAPAALAAQDEAAANFVLASLAHSAPPPEPSPAPPTSAGLLIPVDGVAPEELRDSYYAARSEGRTHRAIDIHAPRGTPVLAVADGPILKLRSGEKGGRTIYQLDEDGHTRYYYAHLDGYADGIEEGYVARRGETIGYVGDTGNAAPGDTHLHFSIAVLSDARRWWEGRNLNPFTLLRRVPSPRWAAVR